MSAPLVTPSKKVRILCPSTTFSVSRTNASLQVAEAIENFKMDSPIKKPVFTHEEKENVITSDNEVAVPIKGIPLDYEPATPAEASVAETIRKEEADEPILQENPQRFVLFPIKYHEVREKS